MTATIDTAGVAGGLSASSYDDVPGTDVPEESSWLPSKPLSSNDEERILATLRELTHRR